MIEYIIAFCIGAIGGRLIGIIQNENRQENIEESKLDETYWNNRYRHNPIIYKAQGEFYRDMRSLINYPSRIAQDIVLRYKLNKDTDEKTLFSILKWCDDNIKYVSDRENYGVLEHWEDSDIVLQKRQGDCEDLALAFKALALTCGIPDYKVKVVAGWVEDPADSDLVSGHAYPIVLMHNIWYTFDPTYYPDYTPIKDRVRHGDNDRYKGIWWTFTRGLCFSQQSVTVDNERIKEL